MLDALELKLVIRKHGNEYTAVTEQRDGTHICANTFQYDPAHFSPLDAKEDELKTEPASWIVKYFTRNKPRYSAEMQTAHYGKQLYQYVFGSGRKFRDFLRSHKQHSLIRLNVVFTPSSAVLCHLPWEYLNDGKVFLSKSRNIQIIRQSIGFSTVVPPPTREPLRILALISSPEDQSLIKVEEELTRLHNTFEENIISGNVELDILPEVTRFTLQRVLNQKNYHIISYTGYIKYDLMQQRSSLCFENAWGQTELLGVPQFIKILKNNIPHLMIIHGQMNVPGSNHTPYNHFSLECLHQGVPAVLNIPFTMHPDSLDDLTRTLLDKLIKGHSVEESLRAARSRLIDLELKALSPDRRLDWGILNCYAGDKRVQPIISPDQPKAPLLYKGYKTAPLFVDRKNILQDLRKAFKENTSIIYLWGHIGAGKSTLISQLLYHTSVKFKGVLRIKCEALREPLSVLSKISDFWASHPSVEHQQAAKLLLDSRQDPFVRAQAAQQHIGQYRYLLIFENIDVWFSKEKATEGKDIIDDRLIRSILLGLLHAPSNTTFLFTGARRWTDLSALPSTHRREIPLPFLNLQWANQLMSSLPGLKTISRQMKETVYWQLGGHPLAIKLLSAWQLAGLENDLNQLFQKSPVRSRSTEDWISYLLKAIVDHLDPGEANVLPVLALLNRPFTDKVLPNLTMISSQYAGTLLSNWRKLELIQDTDVEGQYAFHPLVRNFILSRVSENELRQLHIQAAEYYGAPFTDEAHRQIYMRNVSFQTEERITWLARDSNGILGAWLRQEQDTEKYQELLDLAMSWHYHLFNAGDYQAAAQITTAVVPALHRLGLRDLAGAILQRAIAAAEGYDRAVRMDDLAKIQIADGHLAGALNVYEEVYKSLITHGTNMQRAQVLIRSAGIQQQMGLWQDALMRYERALKILRQEGDQRGQVLCLYQLSTIYQQQDNLQQALVYSQAAKELYNRLVDDRGLASATYLQAIILRDMKHLDGALENFAQCLRICRRLGDFSLVAANLYEIGKILHKLGKTEMAIRTLQEAEKHYKALAAPERNDVMRLLQELYEKQQRLTDAVKRFRAAKNGSSNHRRLQKFLNR